METMSNAIAYICNNDWTKSRLGLERMEQLLAAMGNIQDKLVFAHIAGTNGKGSTSCMLDSVLRTAGYTTGLYTSPFLHCFNERMQVDGKSISDQELKEITEYVKMFADQMPDHPTEFELTTVIAFEYFYRHKCDIVVLEVGLGGRLDATNIINSAAVSVITNIGLDHTKELGNTLEQIAAEKGGIIKKDCPVVLYSQQPEVHEVIQQIAKENNSSVHITEPLAIKPVEYKLGKQNFLYKDYNVKLNMMGAHQQYNAVTAITALEVLNSQGFTISKQTIEQGLEKAFWPGRFELLSKEPLFIVDGGHNPQGMKTVAENLDIWCKGKKAVVLTGVMADKDYKEMYSVIAPYTACFIAVQPDNPRALPKQELKDFLGQYGVPVYSCDSVETGINLAKEKSKEYDNLAVAVGSLYMVGNIRTAFGYNMYTHFKEN